MNLILAANPDCDYVGLLYDTAQDSSTQAIADAKAFLDGKGIQYIEKTGSTTGDVQLAAQALISEGVDAVFTPTDNTVMDAELSIYESFIEDPAQTAVQTFDNGIATVNTETCAALNLDLDTIKQAFAPYCTSVQEITTAESFE